FGIRFSAGEDYSASRNDYASARPEASRVLDSSRSHRCDLTQRNLPLDHALVEVVRRQARPWWADCGQTLDRVHVAISGPVPRSVRTDVQRVGSGGHDPRQDVWWDDGLVGIGEISDHLIDIRVRQVGEGGHRRSAI